MSETMTPIPWIDVVLIIVLIAMNGVLAMSELAIVSAREARLKSAAQEGSKGAAAALELSAQPGRFLSTVQIGITLIGILAGAYSGASLGEPVAERIAALGVEASLASKLGFGAVIAVTTYLSLVIGELVPKQFALRNPEPIAAVVALPMGVLAKITAPLVWLLDKTSAAVFRILGMKRENENHVTAEELHMVVAEAQSAGVLEESERAIISGVVRLADRPVREIMTPRTEVDWIDVKCTADDVRVALGASPHSRLPVANGSIDDIVGVVSSRDILSSLLDGKSIDLETLARPAPVIPDVMDAMDALSVLRGADVPLALVHDEYGHFDGIVTPGSILVALAGHFNSDEDDEEPLIERKDGSFLVAGAAKTDILTDRFGIRLVEDERDFSTVAGFALSVLKRLPEEGECFDVDGWAFEIVDMDGRKIDKLIARRKKRKKSAPAADLDGSAD